MEKESEFWVFSAPSFTSLLFRGKHLPTERFGSANLYETLAIQKNKMLERNGRVCFLQNFSSYCFFMKDRERFRNRSELNLP